MGNGGAEHGEGWDDAGDEKRNRAIEHGNMLGFDSAFCTYIRKAVDTYQNIRHKGYKGWDPQEMVSKRCLPSTRTTVCQRGR